MPNRRPPLLVLLSGGIDSTACLDYYTRQGLDVSALFVDYGQVSARRESTAAAAVADHFGIQLSKLFCSGFRAWSGGCVPGRNGFLLHSALMMMNTAFGIIALGIHSGTPYSDCSPSFISSAQQLLDLYSDGCIRVEAPFLTWAKPDIWQYCVNRRVPAELTYSCEQGKEQPCGQCPSCRDLEVLYAC